MENYRILGQIGSGTYGKVYKAVNNKTNQTVAIKVLNIIDKEEGVSYSALQEIKYLRQLSDCSRVMKLLDVFIDRNKNTVMVFKYADSDLTGILSRSSASGLFKLSLPQAKCLFKQLLEGMVQIHSLGYVHRDIKAANILVHQGQLFLGDFGMMTNYRNRTVFSPNVVTLWYRAPELLLGSSLYGPEIDMWSCGCILVELLTNATPFPGVSEQHQMDLIFKVTGTPDIFTWGTALEQLPGYRNLRKGLYRPALRNIFRDWEPEALDLLEKFFAPPHVRITAEKALEHPFFKAEPLACTVEQIGELPAIHEFEVKKRKMDEANSQLQSRRQPSNNRNPHNPPSRSANSGPTVQMNPASNTSRPHPVEPSLHNNTTNDTHNNNNNNHPHISNNTSSINNNTHNNPNNNNNNNNTNTRRRVFSSRDRQMSQSQLPSARPSTTQQPVPFYSNTRVPPSTQMRGPRESMPSSSVRVEPRATHHPSSSSAHHKPSSTAVSTSQTNAIAVEEPPTKKHRVGMASEKQTPLPSSTSSSSSSSISTSTSIPPMKEHPRVSPPQEESPPVTITSITEEQKMPLSSATISSY